MSSTYRAVRPGQLEHFEVLQQEIEDWFAEPAQTELRLDLERCVPQVSETMVEALVWWARSTGYLAQRQGSTLLVKKASRCA